MRDSTASSTATMTRGVRRRAVLLRRCGGELEYEGPARMCRCGLVSPLCTSWKNVNPGRRFFGCQNYQQGRSCGFFQWYDNEMGERSIVVINELLGHMDSLHDENQRLRRGCDEKEIGVRAEILGMYAEMKKCTRRLKIALCALALTWLFMFVFVYMK